MTRITRSLAVVLWLKSASERNLEEKVTYDNMRSLRGRKLGLKGK